MARQAQVVWLIVAALLFGSYHNHVTAQQDVVIGHAISLQEQLARAHRENTRLLAMYNHIVHHRPPRILQDKTSDVQMEFPSGTEDKACIGGPQSLDGVVAAVVIITFNRPAYLQKHLESVLSVHRRHPEHRERFPLFVSQDGTPAHEGVANMSKSYASQGIRYMHHLELEPPKTLTKKENKAYYRIANHYKFIMETFFDCFKYPRLILLEDDMELAPDFFTYFEATAPLLDSDPSLYCVSSWNDHGLEKFVSDPLQLQRSDFFPGLGWMLTNAVWQDVKGLWPHAYWDDWMRLSAVRKGRQCIRPEICRNFNFGERGSSKGQFFKKFLQYTRLNDVDVDWMHTDLSYLEARRYEEDMNATLAAALKQSDVTLAKMASGDVLLEYDSQEHYEKITGQLQMLREWKDGIPRGAYRGVVTVRQGNARIFIAPSSKFKPPDPNAVKSAVKTDSTGALVRKRDRKAAMGLSHVAT
ncbi:hypothetical protein WJX73_008081 [Symbiochloris irregularis]|uniref:Alpha-1,3-mannosyl-glycoprotein 2-beta-N-acetylglucosaminyltransferase n=1 Tax=Symbiochloris irregularis TaxID=706552 RepID=A0AAW1P0B4_9CHLO